MCALGCLCALRVVLDVDAVVGVGAYVCCCL